MHARFGSVTLVAALGLLAEATGDGVPPARADTHPPVVDIWGWGRTASGETASVPPNAAIPWPAGVPRDWVLLDAGREFTLGLTSRGEVWAWGLNTDGQLGDGTRTSSGLPVRVGDLDGITHLAAGGAHSLAYRQSDGALFAWGSNALGQLARLPDVARSTTPLRIEGVGPLKGIAAGGNHSLALTEDGRVIAWGANYFGQLGTGDLDPRYAPTPTLLAANGVAIAAGDTHTVAAVEPLGEVWSWGLNAFGQLGRGYQGPPAEGEPEPRKVEGPSGVVELACGDIHVLARTSGGRVWAWGYNTEGQVGSGEVTPPYTGVLSAVLLSGIDSVIEIDAGGVQSIALRQGGEVFAWGNNRFGACGDNGRTDRLAPVRTIALPAAIAVTTGNFHAMALAPPRPAHAVRTAGLVGPGSPPVQRPALADRALSSGFLQISSGFRHTLALDGDHRVWAWGSNAVGQLGFLGGDEEAPSPLALPLDGAQGFVQVAARANHGFAVRSDGAVFAWGDNQYGQLGLGRQTALEPPTRVESLTGVHRVAPGERHGLALDRLGRVLGWGQNGQGQLGIGPLERPTPGPLASAGLYGTLDVAAGALHSLALMPSGVVYAWGSAYRGQLGAGVHVDSASLVGLDVPRVTAFSAGRYHSLLVTEGGALHGIGDSRHCQLGPASAPDEHGPVSIDVGQPVLVPQAGDYHGVVWTLAGTLLGFGDDSSGQLGRGDWLQVHADCDPAPIAVGTPTGVAAGLVSTTVIVGD